MLPTVSLPTTSPCAVSPSKGVFDLGAGNGSLFETDITTNRVDAMNHYGVAREAAAIYGLTLAPLSLEGSSRPERSGAEGSTSPIKTGCSRSRVCIDPGTDQCHVSIEASDLCGRFTARVLRDVNIKPSSTGTGGVVASRFKLLEQKQIFERSGRDELRAACHGSAHACFRSRQNFEGGIIVRRARKAMNRLKLLDGTERTLDTDDLVVADRSRKHWPSPASWAAGIP